MEKLATSLAVKIMTSKDIVELAHIGSDIKAICDKDLSFEKEWAPWLRDMYRSRHDFLTEPRLVPAEVLNKAGLKALERKEITLEQ